MSSLVFFLKVYLKKPAVWLAAALILAITVFSFLTPRLMQELPCAVFSCEDSEEAGHVVAYLQERDFLLCEEEEEVYEMVRTGRADCGVILNEEFTSMIREDRLDHCARFLTSDRSMNASQYKLMTAVAIYQQLMPYKAAETAAEMGYPAKAEDIAFYEEQVTSLVNPLEFRITSVEGSVIEDQENYDLPVGAVSITCFIMIGMLCVSLIRKRSEAVRQRFSSVSSYFGSCVLPQCASAGLILFAAGTAGILISSGSRDIPSLKIVLALAVYMVLLTVLFSLVSMLRIPPQILICIIAIDAALSLILCPLYGGTKLLAGFIGPLRHISVPYLMYYFLFW